MILFAQHKLFWPKVVHDFGHSILWAPSPILEEFTFCVNYPFFIAFPYMPGCFHLWTLTEGLPQHHSWVNLEFLPALFCKDSILQSHTLFQLRWCDVWRELLHGRFQDAHPVHSHGHSLPPLSSQCQGLWHLQLREVNCSSSCFSVGRHITPPLSISREHPNCFPSSLWRLLTSSAFRVLHTGPARFLEGDKNVYIRFTPWAGAVSVTNLTFSAEKMWCQPPEILMFPHQPH